MFPGVYALGEGSESLLERDRMMEQGGDQGLDDEEDEEEYDVKEPEFARSGFGSRYDLKIDVEYDGQEFIFQDKKTVEITIEAEDDRELNISASSIELGRGKKSYRMAMNAEDIAWSGHARFAQGKYVVDQVPPGLPLDFSIRYYGRRTKLEKISFCYYREPDMKSFEPLIGTVRIGPFEGGERIALRSVKAARMILTVRDKQGQAVPDFVADAVYADWPVSERRRSVADRLDNGLIRFHAEGEVDNDRRDARTVSEAVFPNEKILLRVRDREGRTAISEIVLEAGEERAVGITLD